jgi:hypothetical protein
MGSDEDLRLLLVPGSSLGGGGPKASLRDGDGHLAIAKFPNKGDEVNTCCGNRGKWLPLIALISKQA